MDSYSIALGAAIASIAWLYQRAWERQARRIEVYQEIMALFSAFSAARLDKNKVAMAIEQIQSLWLFSSDEVVRASQAFLDFTGSESGDQKLGEKVMSEFVLAMRRDASLSASIFPRFWKTKLKASEYKFRTVK